jgi:hypothetical protein
MVLPWRTVTAQDRSRAPVTRQPMVNSFAVPASRMCARALSLSWRPRTAECTVRMVWLPAWSVAVTVNACAPGRAVSSKAPAGTVPVHEARPVLSAHA